MHSSWGKHINNSSLERRLFSRPECLQFIQSCNYKNSAIVLWVTAFLFQVCACSTFDLQGPSSAESSKLPTYSKSSFASSIEASRTSTTAYLSFTSLRNAQHCAKHIQRHRNYKHMYALAPTVEASSLEFNIHNVHKIHQTFAPASTFFWKLTEDIQKYTTVHIITIHIYTYNDI